MQLMPLKVPIYKGYGKTGATFALSSLLRPLGSKSTICVRESVFQRKLAAHAFRSGESGH
jgi:hypothetical protein